MKQENCIKFGMLLESFLSCSSLVQLSLIISPAPLHSLLVESEKLNFPNAAFQVAALLKRLIALFFCVPIPTYVCCKVEKNLLLMIQPTRPAFCVNIKVTFLLYSRRFSNFNNYLLLLIYFIFSLLSTISTTLSLLCRSSIENRSSSIAVLLVNYLINGRFLLIYKFISTSTVSYATTF